VLAVKPFTAQLRFGRIFSMPSPIIFLRQTQDELKKVVWPTRQEVVRLTAVVILVSLIVGMFLGGLDFVFTKVMEIVVK